MLKIVSTFVLSKAALDFLNKKICNAKCYWDGEEESEFSLIIPGNDEKAGNTMAKKSPFGRLFTLMYDENLKNICKNGDINSHYLPEFSRSLLKYFMPSAPLWTGLMLSSEENEFQRTR